MGLEADIKKLEDSLKQKYIQNDDKLKEIIEKKLKAKKEELAKQKKAPAKKEATKKQAPKSKFKEGDIAYDKETSVQYVISRLLPEKNEVMISDPIVKGQEYIVSVDDLFTNAEYKENKELKAKNKPKLVREIARFSDGWLRVVLLEYKNQPKGKYLVQRINNRTGEQENYHYALAISAGKKVLDLIKGQEKIPEGNFTTWLSELPTKAVSEIVGHGEKLGIKFPMGVRTSKTQVKNKPDWTKKSIPGTEQLGDYDGFPVWIRSRKGFKNSAEYDLYEIHQFDNELEGFFEIKHPTAKKKAIKALKKNLGIKFPKPIYLDDQPKTDLKFNKAEQSILDQLKIPADHPYKKAKVGSEDWILEGKKILSDLKKKLPDNKSDYFKKVEGSVIIPISDIQPVKKYEKGNKSLLNAKFFMTLAKDGEIARRKPIEVEALNRGKFKIVDGNATWHVAKQEGWKEIPAIVTTKVKKEVDGEEFDCDELIQEKIETKRKAKKAREERSKKRESTKNVERIEKASDLIEESIEIRLEKGKTLSKAEVEKLIKETEDLLKKLKQIFKTL